jgi:hypothetical protein
MSVEDRLIDAEQVRAGDAPGYRLLVSPGWFDFFASAAGSVL